MVSLTTPQAREAQELYRRSVRAGAPLSGAALGERLGRSRCWAEAQIRMVRAEIGPLPRRPGSWVGHAGEAQQVYRDSVAAGAPLGAVELAERFGKTRVWAARQIDMVRSTPDGQTALTRRSPGSRTAPVRPEPKRPRQPGVSGERLADLYACHHGWLVRYVSARVNRGDRSWAEDIAQEVWLKAWPSLHTVRAQGERVRGWLAAVARNVVANHYSRPMCLARRLENPVDDWDTVPTPDARSGTGRALPAEVNTVLEAMPSLTRRALELHVGHGLTLEATAEELGRTITVVHHRTNDGLRTLRERLGLAA